MARDLYKAIRAFQASSKLYSINEDLFLEKIDTRLYDGVFCTFEWFAPLLEFIEIHGARIHNLKEINVKIPRNKLTVITGVSGSGKSSLAFDTLYEEGKRRYLMFSGTSFLVDSIPTFDRMTGLSPTVAVEQRMIRQSNPRSTVGTRTKLGSLLAILFAQYGERAPEYEDGIPLAMEMFQRNSAKGMCVQCLGSGVSVIGRDRSLAVIHREEQGYQRQAALAVVPSGDPA
ncbi:hypothetical protein [Gorillibacterium sp. CAU 1737]|uniref:hypothetical protein n=1 Tax=Gorillibacterium sp. CAU 1737 TaxID=3140362 RepID=UPI0032618FF1